MKYGSRKILLYCEENMNKWQLVDWYGERHSGVVGTVAKDSWVL
jgi:hypothetical protein